MRLNDGRVIQHLLDKPFRGEDLTIFGDGMQTRSFCYVDDQVEGIFRLLHSDYVYPVNIGNPDEITIKRFCRGNHQTNGLLKSGVPSIANK